MGVRAVIRFAGSRVLLSRSRTGSRTHPWLGAVTHFVGSSSRSPLCHGFADSPVARCRHPLRGFTRVAVLVAHGFADYFVPCS